MKNTAFLAIFQRHRDQDKVPVPAQDFYWLKTTSQYRPKRGHDELFSVPVLDRLVSISTRIVPEPALCPGDSAAERSQTLSNAVFNRFIFQVWHFSVDKTFWKIQTWLFDSNLMPRVSDFTPSRNGLYTKRTDHITKRSDFIENILLSFSVNKFNGLFSNFILRFFPYFKMYKCKVTYLQIEYFK